MEKLFEFLTQRMGYAIAVILGFLFPGMLFIFIWNRQLFLDMEIIRLIILALSISFMIALSNFIVTSIIFMIREKVGLDAAEPEVIFIVPIFISDLEMTVAMIYKLSNPNYSIVQFIEQISGILIILFLIGTFRGISELLIKKLRKR